MKNILPEAPENSKKNLKLPDVPAISRFVPFALMFKKDMDALPCDPN